MKGCALLLVASFLVSTLAQAHAAGFAAARWTHTGQAARLELRATGSRTDALALRPVFPDGCEVLRHTTAMEGEVTVRDWTLRCEERASRPLGFASLRGMQVQLLADGESALLTEDRPLLRDEAPTSTFAAYTWMGVTHIALGWDHLLFVLGLLLLVMGTRVGGTLRSLLWTITAFTAGHSLTLAAASLGGVRVDGWLVEVFIAGSILLLAVEVTLPESPPPTVSRRYPGLVAGAFGLVHGLGFAGALTDLGLPDGARLRGLFGFNVGVELGQIAFVAVALGALRVATLRAPERQKGLARALGYLIGIGGAYALVDRLLRA